MTIRPLGDSAWLVEFPGIVGPPALAQVRGLFEALQTDWPTGVVDVVPAFDSLAVHFVGVDGEEIVEWIQQAKISGHLPAGRVVEIPVCYGREFGPDLGAFPGLTWDEVIALHSGATYTVAAIGFSPGFPYLTGLPEPLWLPRRTTPRGNVAAGSVAVAGGQAGIYPQASPGGWHVLGRTAERLFDPAVVPPALLQCGDRVRFVPTDAWEPAAERVAADTLRGGCIEVIEPGALTTVQDLGRAGFEAQGVSPGGAVDRQALRLANLLVGNDEGAAALEMCLTGPVLKFHEARTIAVAVVTGRSRFVAAGETVDFSALGGAPRACLAVAGGLEIAQVLGSAATDLRGGFGGYGVRALRAGDWLETGGAGEVPECGDWFVGREEGGAFTELRFISGVQEPWFSREARQQFREEIFRVTPRSDRMGARLMGPPLALEEPREMVSQPVCCGSVQVPPDGQPIVLLAARQTMGGYPQIGHVISADLPKLVRLQPGGELRFREVTREAARAEIHRIERDFMKLQCALGLLR